MSNLDKYIGQNFGECFDDICDDLNIPKVFEHELGLAIDGLKKQGLYPCEKTHLIKRIK